MPSLFGGVEVEPKKVEEKPTPVITSAPETKESKFGGVSVGEQKVERPRPGGGLVEDQTFLKKAEPATLWEKAKNLMRDPDKESAKAVQALVDSEAFGVRPHQALEYQDVIAKGTKINAQALSLRSDWTDRVNQSWETGKKQNYIGEIGYKYITTGDPRFLEQIRNVSLPTAEETFISKSVLEDSVRSAAKLMPMVIETGTESVGKGMEVGMGFGLITALMSPGPQAALTVPAATLAGFKIGATAGAFEASLRKEGGLALSEIINFKDEEGNEIDPNIARATAFGIGAINAGIEVAQLRLLINTVPGMSKLFSEATMEVVAGKAVKDKLLALAGKFAGTVATETAQEVAQESTNIVFEELAKSVNNKLLDTDILPTDVETVLTRLEETMIESAQGFAVIALPGTVAKAGLVRGEKAEVAPGEAAPEAPGDITEDVRTEEQILKSIEGQDTIEDTEIDNLLNIDEAEIDAEIDRIVSEAETVVDTAPEAPGEIGPRTQVFQEQVAQVVGEEEATAVNTLLDARAKAAGMTTDEYIDFHGLEIVDGEKDGLSEGDLAQIEEQTKTPEFKAFSKGHEVVAGFDIADAEPNEGKVLKVFHGTTNTFDVFDPTKKGNKEGAFGAVNYFTSDQGDADINYAGLGPDLTNRIEQLVDRLDQADADEISETLGIDFDEASAAEGNEVAIRQLAEENLSGGDPKILELFVRVDNPVYIGGDTKTWIATFDTFENEAAQQQSIDEAWEEVKEENDLEDSEREDYESEIFDRSRENEGFENLIVDAIDTAIRETGNNPSEVLATLEQDLFFEDQVLATDLEKALRDNEELSFMEDQETGELISSHIIGQVFKELGFDAIVLQNANERFPNMDMGSETSHVHVFEETPENIKSATENVGAFDPTDPSILKQEQIEPTGEIKAAVTFTDTKTIIRAFETADVSSLVHELGHVFRRDLGGDELATVETWAGVEDGTWTVDAEEKFARGWENYLATGEAPTAELQSIFEKFKKWMSEIYNSIKGSSIDVEVTPDIKAVFDRLLIPAEEVAPLAQAAEIQTIADIKAKHDENFQTLFISERDVDISIDSIIVPKEGRKSGVGSALMNDIISYADRVGKAVRLTPGTKDDRHGTTSRKRLIKFYKRFGFVENKGRNKDFTYNAGEMYRAPSLKQAAEGGELFQTEQEFNEALEENFREDYIQGYNQEVLDEYNKLLGDAVLAAEKNLDEIQKKEDAVTLKDIKEEAEDIVSSSGVFRDWIEAIDEGGLNVKSAKELSDNETVNQLMKRRPGLFRKDAALHSDHFANRLGFDTADEMFQQWLDAGTRKEAVARTAEDLMNQYEADTEIGRDLTRREDLFELELKELDKVLMKKRPVKISELASRNKLRAAIEKLDRLLAKDPGKRTAKDIRDIKSLQSKKDRIERLIAEGGGFVESLPRAAAGKGIAGPASTKIALKKAISNARKALAKGDAKGVARERARIKEIVARATSRRKKFASVRSIKAKIKKELKFAKVKKVSGKPAGKFTPEIQDILNTLISAAKLKPAEAEAKIAKNLEQYKDGDMPHDVVIENHMLEMVARVDTMKEPKDLQRLLDEIQSLKNEGRLINELKKFNKSEKDRARKEATVEELGGVPEGVKLVGEKDFIPGTQTDKIKRALKTFGKTFVGWDDLMDILSFKSKSKPGESFISRDNDLLGRKNAEKSGVTKFMGQVEVAYKKVFNLKTNRQLIQQVQADNTEEHTLRNVPMTNPIDNTTFSMDLIFTKSELRQRAMELLDPTLWASFQGMGYNEDTKAHIFNSLSAQDKQLMDFFSEFHSKYYKTINKVYKIMNGVNLPRNDKYVPISREGVAKPVDDGMGEFLKEMAFRASAATAGSLKSRVGSTLTISKQSDIANLERHITEMEHFKAWAETIRDLNTVWKDSKVRTAVKINHSSDVLGLVDGFVSDIAGGGATMGVKLRGWDKFRTNFVTSVLAGDISTGIKQLSSFVAFAEKMPVGQFTKYVAKFWANPVKNTKTMYTSELMKARGQNMERDVKAAMQSTDKAAFGKNRSIINMLMMNVTIGDQGAIVVGGWAYYQWLRDVKSLSHDQAIHKFEKFTEQTQQSGDITEQSAQQRGGSFAKMFTTFKSSQNQYLRKEIAALRNLAAGRESLKQTVKILMIYHVVLPMLFQFMSDRFTWDEDEQKRAAIFGSLNGFFILGDGIDFLLRNMLGMRAFDMELSIYSVFHDIVKATALVDLFDLSMDELFRAIRGLAGVVGAGTGLPAKLAVDATKGAVDVLNAEYEKGITEVMGYSPYLAEKLSKD